MPDYFHDRLPPELQRRIFAIALCLIVAPDKERHVGGQTLHVRLSDMGRDELLHRAHFRGGWSWLLEFMSVVEQAFARMGNHNPLN
tara:strand:- start:42 stop:299 length:258 start_codon:yes stop_codon:yes gene_type:complete